MEIKKFSDVDQISESYDEQLEMGIKIESEHCDIYEEIEKWIDKNYQEYSSMPFSKRDFYKKIAEAHIKEIPDYYTRLQKMENK